MTLPHVDDTTAIYSPAQVIALCDDLKIDHTFASEISRGLHYAALVWQEGKIHPLEAQTKKETRKELRKVRSALIAAHSELANLSDAAWATMRYASDSLNSDPYISGIEGVAGYKRDGHSIQRVLQLNDETDPRTLPLADIEASLGILANFAAIAAELVPASKSGPEPDRQLARWMFNIHKLFRKSLPIQFSRDVASGGAAISRAAYFCVNAFKVLSPETEQSKVLNAMKNEIKKHNEASTGRVREIRF